MDMEALTFTVSWSSGAGSGENNTTFHNLADALHMVEDKIKVGWKCVTITSSI